MSPDVFLSRLGLKYDNTQFKGTPAEIVDNLIKLTAAYDAGTYRTEDFVPAAVPSFNPANTEKLRSLINKYFTVLQYGNIDAVHKAVDDINHLRMKIGGQEQVPPSELEIIAHANSPVGEAAKYLFSMYAESGSVDDFFNLNGDAIRNYAKENVR